MKLSRGFSLIEVLVSIFIMGVMLVMLQAVLRSNVLVKMSKNQGVALSIARNEIEILRMGGYDSLPASGSFYSDLLSTIPGAVTELAVDDYNAKTKQVTVQVSWKDSGATASSTVSLSTLITQVGGLP
jgi:prepilin-type N-terminal cleavage/methylation domain-containing protein